MSTIEGKPSKTEKPNDTQVRQAISNTVMYVSDNNNSRELKMPVNKKAGW